MDLYAGSAYASFSTRNAAYLSDANGMIYGVTGTSNIADLVNDGCVPIVTPPFANLRNLIDGGDFTTNPWQRDIAGLATSHAITTAITNTATYFADRFFHVGGASSSIVPAKVTDTTIPGFGSALKVQRSSSNADTTAITTGQVIETANAIKCQGQKITLSFWAKAGANYSGGNLTATIACGTGSNQSAANLVAGSWTSQANVAQAAVALTSLYQRYAVSGVVPIGATQLGVLLQWTPTGTAGTDDSVTFQGVQLELGAMSPFEHRAAKTELGMCQRYAWVVPEPASSVVVGAGSNSASNVQIFYLSLPVQMYKAPAVTTAVGTFKVNSSTGGVAAATGLAGVSAHPPNAIGLTSTGTGTAGQASILQGGGGSGYVMASADF